MYPVLFRLGPLTVHSYGVMMAVGFIVSAWLLRKELARMKLDPEVAYELVTAAAIGGVVGAKINFLIFHWDAFTRDPFGMAFSGAGLVWYGGLFGGGAAFLWWAHRKGIQPGLVAGLAAPMLALGPGFGRIGCFLVGDDWGKPSDLPWALAFPNGIDPVDYPVHPTQVYHMIALFAIFAILWLRREKMHSVWIPFYWVLILSGAQRFIVELFRKNEVVLAGMTVAQITSIILIAIGLFGIYRASAEHSVRRAAARQGSR